MRSHLIQEITDALGLEEESKQHNTLANITLNKDKNEMK